MIKNYTPVKDKIYVEVEDPFVQDDGDIYIKQMDMPQCLWGSVLAVGNDVRQVKKGDRVCFAPDTVRVDFRVKTVIIPEEDILGISCE